MGQKMPTRDDEVYDRMAALRPLRWFLVASIAILYFWGELWLGTPRDPAWTLKYGLAVLMLVHAGGHWLSPSLMPYPRRLAAYFAAQALLVVLISGLSHNPLVVFGLYLILAGAAVILFGRPRPAAAAVLGFTGIAILTSIPFRRGAEFDLLVYLVPMILIVTGAAVLFLQQSNARVRSQALLRELEAAHQQLAAYAENVEALTLVNERQRMARELHDTLAQGLAGLVLQLEAADSHLAQGGNDRARVIVRQAMSRARATLAEARQVIVDLREQDVSLQDLGTSVQEEVSRFTATTGIPCALELAVLSLPSRIREPTLRIVNEGLTNVARHAYASQTWVRIAAEGEWLDVEVRDNGIGFSPEAAGRPGHYGLRGLRERASLAGGSLELTSEAGQGTSLRVRFTGLHGGEAR